MATATTFVGLAEHPEHRGAASGTQAIRRNSVSPTGVSRRQSWDKATARMFHAAKMPFLNLSSSQATASLDAPSGSVEDAIAKTSPVMTSSPDHSPMASPTLRFFKRVLSHEPSRRSFSEDLPVDPNVSKHVAQLSMILDEREHRDELVSRLLAAHKGDAARKVRLVSGLTEVLRTTDRNDRNFKAGKLMDAFVRPHARYAVEGIPPAVTSGMTSLRPRGLEDATQFLLIELVGDETVCCMLTEYETILSDTI